MYVHSVNPECSSPLPTIFRHNREKRAGLVPEKEHAGTPAATATAARKLELCSKMTVEELANRYAIPFLSAHKLG